MSAVRCPRCGGSDPYTAAGDICRCGTEWTTRGGLPMTNRLTDEHVAREWHTRLRERFAARFGGRGGVPWDDMSAEWRKDMTAVAASMLADLDVDLSACEALAQIRDAHLLAPDVPGDVVAAAAVNTAENYRKRCAELDEARRMLATAWPCVVRTEWAIRSETGLVYGMRDEAEARAAVPVTAALRHPVEVVSREVREAPWMPVDVTSATDAAERPISGSVDDATPERPSGARTETRDDRMAAVAEFRDVVRRATHLLDLIERDDAQAEATLREGLASAIERERSSRLPFDGEPLLHDKSARDAYRDAARIVRKWPIGGAE